MTKWEIFEDYLYSTTRRRFTCIIVAQDMSISHREASDLIQAYLKAQRRPNSTTAFVLCRQGRTSSAVWHVGVLTDDVRGLANQVVDDLAVKITGALIPDTRRQAELHPRVRQLAEGVVQMFLANVNLMAIQIP
jgi:hypothetical protein